MTDTRVAELESTVEKLLARVADLEAKMDEVVASGAKGEQPSGSRSPPLGPPSSVSKASSLSASISSRARKAKRALTSSALDAGGADARPTAVGSSPLASGQQTANSSIYTAPSSAYLMDHLQFGSSLETIVERERSLGRWSSVPFVVETCVDVIRAGAWLDVPGIFRRAGSKAKTDSLRVAVLSACAEGRFDVAIVARSDVYVVCDLLRQFLKQLEEPVVPTSCYDDLVRIGGVEDVDQRKEALHQVVTTLPVESHACLMYLVDFWRDVVSHSDQNQMGAKNLAVVFAPSIFRSSSAMDDLEAAKRALQEQTPLQVCLVDMLDHSEAIFYDEGFAAVDWMAGRQPTEMPKLMRESTRTFNFGQAAQAVASGRSERGSSTEVATEVEDPAADSTQPRSTEPLLCQRCADARAVKRITVRGEASTVCLPCLHIMIEEIKSLKRTELTTS